MIYLYDEYAKNTQCFQILFQCAVTHNYSSFSLMRIIMLETKVLAKIMRINFINLYLNQQMLFYELIDL